MTAQLRESGLSRRALVTGGAGFIGSHLCERLLAAGWVVHCVDNFLTGAQENPAGAVDVVFHLACPASPVQYTQMPLQTLETAAFGTANVLALARQKGAIFVLASTSEIYGDPQVHPQIETYWGNVDPIGPRSMYDEGKRFAEALAAWHARVHALDVRIVRIFNTYGPRLSLWDGRVVSTFIRQALMGEPLTLHGDGEQTRSLCYVDDLIEGLVRVAEASPGAVNELPINLGNPDERPIRRIAEAVLACTGSSAPIQSLSRLVGDPQRRQPDITRAKTVLGWAPTVGLEEGLYLTVEWARQHLDSGS